MQLFCLLERSSQNSETGSYYLNFAIVMDYHM